MFMLRDIILCSLPFVDATSHLPALMRTKNFYIYSKVSLCQTSQSVFDPEIPCTNLIILTDILNVTKKQ